MTPTPTDEELMVRVQRGDRWAYDELYRRWKQPLFYFLGGRLGCRQDAEDALSEVWLRIYRHRDRFDAERGSFKSWAFRIAYNSAADTWNARPPDWELLDCDGRQPWSPQERAEMRDLALKGLGLLDAVDRAIIVLVVLGFKAREIAQIMKEADLKPDAVRKRLSRARERIRQALMDDDGSDPPRPRDDEDGKGQ